MLKILSTVNDAHKVTGMIHQANIMKSPEYLTTLKHFHQERQLLRLLIVRSDITLYVISSTLHTDCTKSAEILTKTQYR